jgi:hypothetical protein
MDDDFLQFETDHRAVALTMRTFSEGEDAQRRRNDGRL